MNKSNNANKTPAQKKSVRIIALILAVLMVAGVATIGISLIAAAIGSNDTTQSDPHAGHDHD
jgi:flagellar basal body-associated protein FliL